MTQDMQDKRPPASAERRLIGSLRDALAAAARTETPMPQSKPLPLPPPPPAASAPKPEDAPAPPLPPPSAAEAVREARAKPMARDPSAHVEIDVPTTKVVRGSPPKAAQPAETDDDDAARTQLIRGKVKVSRTDFHQDPVVGWLVIVGGAGLGAFRPIFEGNNTVGRASTQRIPIDFGDDSISSEEQAYIRYDSGDRKFLLVPNLAKTNIVAVNGRKPTGAVELAAMDLIAMGRTQLVFVPFCGNDFDWAELSEMKD
jgi:hypothetical protein